MSDALVPVITNAGLAAAVNAQNNGLLATIAQIGVGQGVMANGIGAGYTPSATATALKSEVIRVPLLSGTPLSPAGFSVLAQIPASSAPASYTIWEVGFYLDTGVLLAVWSSPLFPLAAKTALSDIDIAFDLLLTTLPAGSINITVQDPSVPDASGVLASLLTGLARQSIELAGIQDRLTLRNL